MGWFKRLRDQLSDPELRYALRARQIEAHEREVQVLEQRQTVTLEALRYMIELTCPECSEAGRTNVLIQCLSVAEKRVLRRLENQQR